jgi:hypothetical protein
MIGRIGVKAFIRPTAGLMQKEQLSPVTTDIKVDKEIIGGRCQISLLCKCHLLKRV